MKQLTRLTATWGRVGAHQCEFWRHRPAAIAAAQGMKSWRVQDPAEFESVIRKAIAHDGPALIDIVTQSLEERRVGIVLQ